MILAARARELRINLRVVDGDTIEAGELILDVLHTPGHSPGGVVFVLPAAVAALVGVARADDDSGDSVFMRSHLRMTPMQMSIVIRKRG